MKRVIFVDPKIENYEVIFDIFKKYNPDCSFVNPHIYLVFPFGSDLEKTILELKINNIFNKYSKFNIQLSGLSVIYEENNNFLFLNVIDDLNILKKMSRDLYSSLEDNAILRGEYIPHITIGKCKTVDGINQMYNSSKNLLQGNYDASISTIYCKKLIKYSKGNIKLEDEIEFELNQVFNKTI